ncbi:MAG: ParB N-terminal domain-containing protein [Sphingomonas sp.]|nr:ParB N-terminal domain-containing protein [Sphingomonas sp.]
MSTNPIPPSPLRSNYDAIQVHVEHVAIQRVSPAARPLKKHRKQYIAKLAAGISRFGFLVPMLVDEEYRLVSGHARLAAAQLNKLDQVPVIRVDHLTSEQLRMLAIYENKIAQESEFDEEALNLEFEELRLTEPEIELTDSGFAIGEIDALAGRSKTKALDDLDHFVEEPPERPPTTRLGDEWQCGRHRIICGDCTDPEVMTQLADGAKVRQVIADCPYNRPTRDFSSSGRFGDFQMAAGEMDRTEFIAFLGRFFAAATPQLIDGALLYTFMDAKHIGELLAAAERADLDYKQLLVWVKGSAGQGSFYRSGHELIGVFKYGEGPSQNNIQLGRYGRNRSNVLSYPGVMGTASGKRALTLHPTCKNIAMIADLMLDASSPGDNILDSFGGSGTTMIAAEKTDRTAYLCELSPAFVDVTVERFNALGGEQARLKSTGLTFEEVRAERLEPAPEREAE